MDDAEARGDAPSDVRGGGARLARDQAAGGGAVRSLASRGAPVGRGGALHAADLYLACACEVRAPGAVEAFERGYVSQVGAFLARFSPPPDVVDEVRQVLREKLLVGSPGAAPKIAEYDGRGALASFVRVVALRAAIDLRRRRRSALAAREPGPGGGTVADPEIGYLKTRYRHALDEAMRGAVRALGAEERELLRLHFVDGLTLDRQAEVLGVHRATIARRLAAVRRAAQGGRAPPAPGRARRERGRADSVIRLVRSQLELSLPGLLREA